MSLPIHISWISLTISDTDQNLSFLPFQHLFFILLSDKQCHQLVNQLLVQPEVINNHLENLAYFSDNSLLIYMAKKSLPTG